MKKVLFVCMAACCCVSCQKNADVQTAATQDSASGVQLIVWNDYHSTLYEAIDKTKADTAVGGLPVWMATVEAIKQSTHDPVLLLDAGDMFQGATPLNDMKGKGMVEIMKAVGLDVTTFGNHEFDYGKSLAGGDDPQGAIKDVVAASPFAWVSANVVATDASSTWPPEQLKPYTILQKGPYRIAVTGVTTTETPVAVQAANIAGITFKPVAESLAEVLPKIQAEHPDFTIVLAHVTGEPSPMPEFNTISTDATFDHEIGEIMALPAELRDQIGLLVTGHLHISFLYDNGKTLITQGHSNSKELTTLRLVPRADGKGLEIDRKSIQKYELAHKPIYKGCAGGYDHPDALAVSTLTVKPDERGYEMTSRFESAMSENLCDVMACTTEPLFRNNEGESAVGNLVTDATRSAFAESDGAILNAGGLRIDWPQGKLYRELVSAMMPFENYAYLVDMSGQEIIDVIRLLSSGHHHGVVQVSGISYKVQTKCERTPEDINQDGVTESWEMSCLCSGPTINGQPIDPQKRYKIVMSDFLFNGGDSIKGILKTSTILEKGPLMKRTIMDYISSKDACFGSADLIDPQAPRITVGTCDTFL